MFKTLALYLKKFHYSLSGRPPAVAHPEMAYSLPACLRLGNVLDHRLCLDVLRQVERGFTGTRLRVDVRPVLAEQFDEFRLVPGRGLQN